LVHSLRKKRRVVVMVGWIMPLLTTHTPTYLEYPHHHHHHPHIMAVFLVFPLQKQQCSHQDRCTTHGLSSNYKARCDPNSWVKSARHTE
jgi:hypothetical protein